jgi:aminoglycoside phosphotransferase family enzyme/predicted kinase
MDTDLSTQRALIANLREVLPREDRRAPVEVIETHISWVLLTGAVAYKIKKAVDLGFLDFTTLARRRHLCEQELRLNRRLAPAIYLDVVAIAGTIEHPVPGGSGPPLEYAVTMREFPQDALASHVLARGELTPAHVDALAADVAAFHSRIASASAGSEFGRPDDILGIALSNLEATRAATDDPAERALLDALRDWTQREHAACALLLAQRREQGFIRECHGDLHLGNMVLIDDRLTVFDCIEFNDGLRWIDVMSEAAFVVMDLWDRGAPALAHRFLNDYLEITGDYAGLPVLRFYLASRAMVRAMVTRLRVNQMQAGDARSELLAEYRAYLDLARHFARPPRPAIVIAHGLSGSGKTTLTQAFLERTGAVRIRTDVERKRLHGLAAEDRTKSAIDSGLYAADATRATYQRVLADARCVVAAGDIAVIDATFLHRWQRDLFRQLAGALGVPFVIVAFAAPESTLRRRLAQRTREGRGASDADIAVLEHQLRTQEPLAPDEQACVVAFDAEAPGQRDAWDPVLARIGAMDAHRTRCG